MDGSAQTDRTDLDRQVREGLAARGDVAFAYLFGSRAKGTARPDSDVDLAVHFGADVGRGTDGEDTASVERKKSALELEGVLERELGRRVQVVVLEDAPPGLAHNVLDTGRLVFCRDDRARRHFFVAHCKRYFEMQHIHRIFDRYRLRRLEQGTFGGRQGDAS